MDAASLILVLVAVPAAFCVLTWVVATAYRIYFPEHPLSTEGSLEPIPRRRVRANEPVGVGVREIKEDQRRLRRVFSDSFYSYANGFSSGVPSDWLNEMWRRRN